MPKTVTTRDNILDAAEQVIHTLGLANTTTREIAQAAGLSEAALYKHFDDKNELFLCVLRERLPDVFVTLQDLPNRVGRRTVRANLEDLMRTALTFFQQSAPFAAALFSRPELLKKYQEHMRSTGGGPHRAKEILSAYLRAEQRIGRVAPDVNVDMAASLLMAACLQRAFVSGFIGETHTQQADERFIKEVVRLVMRALARRSRHTQLDVALAPEPSPAAATA